MKIALLQCDVIPGKPVANAQKLASLCMQAPDSDLCIAPAEALTGPLPDCSAREALDSLPELAQALTSGPAMLCAVSNEGNFLLRHGNVETIQSSFQFENFIIGLDEFFTAGQVDLIINMRSQRFTPRCLEERELVLSAQAARAGAFALSVNLVGGYGGTIYSGQSLAVDPKGTLTGRGKAFAEEILLIDTANSANNTIAPLCSCPEEAQWHALTLGLADFIHKAGAKTAVLGLSGGMDSALVATIACSALGPENVTGILMPSQYTSRQSVTDAELLAKNLAMPVHTIPIAPLFTAFKTSLAEVFAATPRHANDLTEENLQARIRGVLLMAFANRTGALVLNTGNKSEAAMGYSTLYGDTVGAVAVIGDIFKTQVYALAKWRNEQESKRAIPRSIFDKAPTAELRPNQKDTDSLPPYNVLDPRLERLLNGDQSDRELLEKVKKTAFKRRQCPPALLVSAHPLAQICPGA